MKILLVDDDRDLVDLLTFVLNRAGFEPLAAYDVPSALRLLDQHSPDLAVLDVNLGAPNGFELLEQLRRRTQIPVIMLTARDAEEDKVRGLELGADDYLTKPFGHRELIARIRAHLRRGGHGWAAAPPAQPLLECGPLTLNAAEHSASKNGQPLDLSLTEFRLLQHLMLSAGAVVPARTLLAQIWGHEDPAAASVLRVTLHRLRSKIEDDPARPRLLHTVPGVGILLKPEPNAG